MLKRLYILWIFCCVGIILFPAQNSIDTFIESSCCKNSNDNKGCCSSSKDDDKACHESTDNQQQDHCKDQCNSCNSCQHTLISFVFTPFKHLISKKIENSKSEFSYHFPKYINTTFNIWQPPKLA